jgi:hypothetical protein
MSQPGEPSADPGVFAGAVVITVMEGTEQQDVVTEFASSLKN